MRIHYAAFREGPIVVVLRGFPDFWYAWREPVRALANDFAGAVDTRGHDSSDELEGASDASPARPNRCHRSRHPRKRELRGF